MTASGPTAAVAGSIQIKSNLARLVKQTQDQKYLLSEFARCRFRSKGVRYALTVNIERAEKQARLQRSKLTGSKKRQASG
jgi:hypothetical protein